MFVCASLVISSPQQQFDKYFAANAVEKGGSFYLQSKIYRAKEMLDAYIQEKKAEEEEKKKDKETPKDEWEPNVFGLGLSLEHGTFMDWDGGVVALGSWYDGFVFWDGIRMLDS